jgi:hypothetical protein
MCLDLQGGNRLGCYWDKDGASLGEYWMRNTSECPSAAVESSLSQILEANAPEKYYLSAKACQGILTRAKRRGKAVPEILRVALERQGSIGGREQGQG